MSLETKKEELYARERLLKSPLKTSQKFLLENFNFQNAPTQSNSNKERSKGNRRKGHERDSKNPGS